MFTKLSTLSLPTIDEQAGQGMLNIESRPLEGKSWEYFFHIDISGNLIDANVQKALNEIEVDGSCRVLGNYVAAQS